MVSIFYVSPGLSVDSGFVDAVPAVATAVLVFVVVIVVLANGLFDDVEVTVGDWLESLFDEFFNVFFPRLISNSCNFFHSSSRSRSRFFSLANLIHQYYFYHIHYACRNGRAKNAQLQILTFAVQLYSSRSIHRIASNSFP